MTALALFELRNGETFSLFPGEDLNNFNMCLLAHKVLPLPEPRLELCDTGINEGLKVSDYAIIACQKNIEGKWQWMQMTPDTREYLGHYLFKYDLKDQWVGVRIYRGNHQVF